MGIHVVGAAGDLTAGRRGALWKRPKEFAWAEDIPWISAWIADDLSAVGDGNPVSSWSPHAGAETAALTQGVGASQPTYNSADAVVNSQPSVTSDGVDDYLQTAAWSSTYAQPLVRATVGYFIGKPGYLLEGRTLGTRLGLNMASTSIWRLYAGSSISTTTTFSLSTAYGIILVTNGASGGIIVDGTSEATGNAGAHSIDGSTLFAAPGPAGHVAGGIAFDGFAPASSLLFRPQQWADFATWANAKWGVSF